MHITVIDIPERYAEGVNPMHAICWGMRQNFVVGTKNDGAGFADPLTSRMYLSLKRITIEL